jgi:hypothetical protein
MIASRFMKQLVPLAAIAIPLGFMIAIPSYAQVSQEIHNKCLRASDYSGCVLQQKAAANQNPDEIRRSELRRAMIQMALEQQRQNHQREMLLLQTSPLNSVPSIYDYMQLFN